MADLTLFPLGIHTFDRSDFARDADAASAAESQLKEGTARVWSEYRYRRNGLLVATGVISLFGILLYFKIREVDRK